MSIAGYLVDSSTWHKGLQTAQFFTAAMCVTPFVGLISLRPDLGARQSRAGEGWTAEGALLASDPKGVPRS